MDSRMPRNGEAEGTSDIPLEANDVEGSVEAAETDGVGMEASAEKGRDLAAEYLDALQRERASFINYRRRTEQESAEAARKARASVLTKLLGVVDDFDRALEAIPQAERENNRWVEGIELIARKLHNVLESEGVKPIEAKGQPFDPNLHEAVAFEEGSEGGHTDTVSEVFSKGYIMNDRVLRPAMVKVVRG